MSSTGPISSVAELLAKIRQGMAPRAIRLFAAQGLLPVPREELIRVNLILAADGDKEVADAARATLSGFTTENFMAVLQAQDADPLEIDLLARCAQDEALWQAIAQHPNTANETMRWIARVAPPVTQDVLITNQVRVMGCLELLDDLRANPQVTQEVLRRVREFEEEFLQKAIVWASSEGLPVEAPPEGPSIEQVLEELRAIGMRLPGAEIEFERSKFEVEPEAPAEVRDATARIGVMNTAQRVMLALTGNREERLILVRDRSPLVVRAVMLSPKLNEVDVERIAGMRGTNEEALRIIASRPRWMKRYGVLHNLAFNPKTPAGLALQLIRRLSQRDLGLISRDRGVSETVRRVAKDLAEHRR
jgi:hypothetical protein